MSQPIHIRLQSGGLVIVGPADAEELYEKLGRILGRKECACGRGKGQRCVV